MRKSDEIMEYARAAPYGEPLPITESEVSEVARYLWGIRSAECKEAVRSIEWKIRNGAVEILSHKVVVL